MKDTVHTNDALPEFQDMGLPSLYKILGGFLMLSSHPASG